MLLHLRNASVWSSSFSLQLAYSCCCGSTSLQLQLRLHYSPLQIPLWLPLKLRYSSRHSSVTAPVQACRAPRTW